MRRYPKVPPGVAVGEPCVVQAHKMEDGGVKVVDMDCVLDGLNAMFVGFTVGDARLDARAGKPA